MGADTTADVSRGEEPPRDVDVVLEASGPPAAPGAVLRATARGGTLVQVGNLPGTAEPAVLEDLVGREITRSAPAASNRAGRVTNLTGQRA